MGVCGVGGVIVGEGGRRSEGRGGSVGSFLRESIWDAYFLRRSVYVVTPSLGVRVSPYLPCGDCDGP